MAAPHITNANAEKHNLLIRLGRGGYALPKGLCTKSSEWRLPPGKPAERLAPHYKLDCDFGTSLMIAWKNDGSEPIYVCDGHARELGVSLDAAVSASELPGQPGTTRKNETPAMAGPFATPKKAPSVSSGSDRTHHAPAEPAQSSAERHAAINRQISECVAEMETILSRSQSTIGATGTIDLALEQAALEIIDNPAMTETQKDETIQRLGALQESLKPAAGPDLTPLKAYRIKQAVGERLSENGNATLPDEEKPYHHLLHDSLRNAIHAAVPEVKDIEERLGNLLNTKAELENLPQPPTVA